jgi:eukaryotic-like serine/threonine-protein kinase
VMGARAAGALRRHLGSVSSAVVAEAACTVTVVRLKDIADSGG